MDSRFGKLPDDVRQEIELQTLIANTDLLLIVHSSSAPSYLAPPIRSMSFRAGRTGGRAINRRRLFALLRALNRAQAGLRNAGGGEEADRRCDGKSSDDADRTGCSMPVIETGELTLASSADDVRFPLPTSVSLSPL